MQAQSKANSQPDDDIQVEEIGTEDAEAKDEATKENRNLPPFPPLPTVFTAGCQPDGTLVPETGEALGLQDAAPERVHVLRADSPVEGRPPKFSRGTWRMPRE